MGACPHENGHGQAVGTDGFAWTEAGWAGSPAGVEQIFCELYYQYNDKWENWCYSGYS